MALATALKKIQTARKNYDSALSALGRKALAKELGALIPKGYAIAWTQYTPGFNDGDPCTFTLDDPSIASIKQTVEVEPLDEEDEDVIVEAAEVVASEPTATGDVASCDATMEAALEAVEDEEPEYEEVDREDWDDVASGEAEDSAGITYGTVSSMRAAGIAISSAELATLRKAWKAIPKDAFAKAFGDGSLVVIRSGGKLSVDEYDCGY